MWDGSLLHALPFRAIQAVLLVLIGFYVELLVLRTISHAPLWDTARLIEAAQEPIEGETVLGGDTQLQANRVIIAIGHPLGVAVRSDVRSSGRAKPRREVP